MRVRLRHLPKVNARSHLHHVIHIVIWSLYISLLRSFRSPLRLYPTQVADPYVKKAIFETNVLLFFSVPLRLVKSAHSTTVLMTAKATNIERDLLLGQGSGLVFMAAIFVANHDG
jgi:hypothetical protein